MQWMMLQQESPQRLCYCYRAAIFCRDFVTWSANELGIEISFEGKGEAEVGVISKLNKVNKNIKIGDIIVRVSSKYYRPAEVETLLSDPQKAKNELGWEPKISVKDMCAEMVEEDLKLAKQNKQIQLNNSGNPPISNEKIFIAGHNGMVGSAIHKKLSINSDNKIFTQSRSNLDLTIQSDVNNFLVKIILMKSILLCQK